MPKRWQRVSIYNLTAGEKLEGVEWYTRWNRAYSHDGTIGSGWLGVMEIQA